MDDLIRREDAIKAACKGFCHSGIFCPDTGCKELDPIKNLPAAEPKTGKWIPCKERLPEENGEYLVTREAKGKYNFVEIVKKTNVSGDIASDIVAWMPLPEPYKEGEQK